MEKDDKAVGIGSALLVLVIAAGIYFYKFAATAPAPVEPALPAAAPSTAAAPGAPPAEPLPKLQDSDDFIRGKAAALSSDPLFASWLKTGDLIPRFAAAASLIGQGRIPRDALSFLAPRRKFKVRKKGENFFADPSDAARYDAAAGAIASLDAAAAARLFQECKPLFQEAYESLGEKKGDVQDALVAAARELLKTPVVPGPVPLKEKGIVYAYADDALESLSPAQKQLLRMGPKNEAAIQAKLGELLRALGAPGL